MTDKHREKELEYFTIGYSYGGNQNWFQSYMMRLGGCGAETACDLSIYLKLYKGLEQAYDGNVDNITRKEYVEFAHHMKKYLWPRLTGIDKVSTWIEGYEKYLNDQGVKGINLSAFSGNEPYTHASSSLIRQIDQGFPVPTLTLRHKDKLFTDYNWHWYIINGYRMEDDGKGVSKLMVKAVTYSEYEWLDFEELWDTGYDNKGGFVIISM